MLRISFLLVVCLTVAGAARAAPAAKAFGTRDQLRECLDLDDALRARWQAIQAATEAHNRKFEENDAEEARLVEMKAKLDRSDKNAILAFNKAVAEHGQHIQQVNQEGDDAEAVGKVYAADRAAADAKCANLTYRPADADAVAKERKKASVPAAAASAS